MTRGGLFVSPRVTTAALKTPFETNRRQQKQKYGGKKAHDTLPSSWIPLYYYSLIVNK
jgi:hypothetical protein